MLALNSQKTYSHSQLRARITDVRHRAQISSLNTLFVKIYFIYTHMYVRSCAHGGEPEESVRSFDARVTGFL